MVKTAKKEKKMKRNLGLYIHIPFCNSKCNYCSFVSMVGTDNEKMSYIDCLKKELAMRAKEYNSYYTISSIYIGGGTPSCLPVGAIKDIFQTIYKYFTVRNDAEITMELNPNTATEQKINEYVTSGVNRFSIGLQCIDKNVLLAMGRTHTVEDFDRTIDLIRDNGISNISADIIVGYPDQSTRAVVNTVEHLIDMKIPHVSAYMLSVEEGTPLQMMLHKGVKNLPSENTVVKMFNSVSSALIKSGYERYEVSNFAKPGFTSRHNKIYWRREDYLGVGVAAHSCISNVRFSNTEDVNEYCTCIRTKGKPPVAHAKKLTLDEQKEEYIMLSLRTSEGLDTKGYMEQYGENFLAKYRDKLAEYIKLGLLVIDSEGRVRATDKGFLVLNRIILELVS